MKRAPYGAGIADRGAAKGPQRHCKCGEPIAGNKKKYCWECEGKILDARELKRRSKKAGSGARSIGATTGLGHPDAVPTATPAKHPAQRNDDFLSRKNESGSVCDPFNGDTQ